MVESSLITTSVEESGSDDLESKDKRSGISRDPSFSGWCAEDQISFPAQLKDNEVNEKDFHFKLPLFQLQESENKGLDGESFYSSNSRQRMEHARDINDGISTTDMRYRNESYMPLDIENDHDFDKKYTNGANGFNHVDYHRPSSRNMKNPISVADVLKTLFFILVWYTFSTFLTLYNKTLLGDDMGKFPAPLLMNTLHFAMQAALSRAITWFWSQRFHSPVMSWKDYFMRDGLCLSQLYQRL